MRHRRHERTSPGRALLDFANEGRFRLDAVQINDWAERTLWQKRSATTLGGLPAIGVCSGRASATAL